VPKKIVGILTEHLVDHFDEACIGIDKEGRIHFFNRSAEVMFGVAASAAIGQKIWDALEMSDFTRAFARVVKSGGTDAHDRLVLMPDQRALQAQFLAVHGSEGRLAGAVAVLRDVTSLQRIERDVSTLVGRIAEEMRIPLTSIKGYVETLLEGGYSEPAILRRFLQIINDETNRMARLLVGLLDAGERPSPSDAPLGPVSVSRVVGEVTTNLAPLVAQKCVRLDVDVASSLPPVRANEALLSQAVTNVLDNAIKIVGLNALVAEKAGETGRVRLVARCEASSVLLEVHDNGVGIAADEMDRIFERFARVTRGPAAQLGGTGLGLPIAREIVQAFGGRLEARSREGQGSCFTMTLPAVPAP